MKSETHLNPQENIRKLAELMKDIRIAMMTTLDPDGSLRSRPMAQQETEFDGDLWFFTGKSSGKVHSIEGEHQVNLAYASPKDNRYVSVTGRAEVIDDREKAKELWSPALQAWFPKGLEDPELTLLKVHVESAEYWDSPSSTMVQLLGFMKAALTGEQARAPLSEHARVRMPH